VPVRPSTFDCTSSLHKSVVSIGPTVCESRRIYKTGRSWTTIIKGAIATSALLLALLHRICTATQKMK